MSRKRQQLLVFGFGFVLALVLLLVAAFIWFRVKGINPFHAQQAPAETMAAAVSTHAVVIAKLAIPAGALIAADMLDYQERPVTDIPLSALLDTSEAVGRYAAVALDGKVIVTSSMISDNSIAYQGTDRLCDYEIPGYLVNNLIEPGMLVDVQLVRSSGHTYTVLAKKGVRVKAENRVVLAVSFAEMDLVNQAFAEQAAGLGRMQIVTYLDSTQEASIVNYVPDPNRLQTGIDGTERGPASQAPQSATPIAANPSSIGTVIPEVAATPQPKTATPQPKATTSPQPTQQGGSR